MSQFQPKLYKPAVKQKVERIPSRRVLISKDHYEKKPVLQSRSVRTVIVVIAVLLALQACFQTPLFRVNSIQITGLKYVAADHIRSIITDELQKRRLLIFKNNNIFLFSKKKLSERLARDASIDVVSMKKRFPNGIIVAVKERIAAFVLQTPEKYYKLDLQGKKIGDLSAPLPGQTIIADERAQPGGDVNQQYLETITMIQENWQEQIQKVTLAKFHLTDDTNSIIISTNAPYRVLLNPKSDLANQIKRFAAFLADTSIEQPKNHVDLRYDGRIFAD